MQFKWICPIAVLALALLQPTRSGGLKFIPIHEALTIRAHKSSPPHIAFEELISARDNLRDGFHNGLVDEWAEFENRPGVQLAVQASAVHFSPPRGRLFQDRLQKIVLNEMTITKTPQIVYPGRAIAAVTEASTPARDLSWIQELPVATQKRMELAQARSGVLDEDWSQTSWSEEVQKVLLQSGAMAREDSGQIEFSSQKLANNSKVIVQSPSPAGDGQTISKVDEASVSLLSKPAGEKFISGPLEIVGGLAVTNEHYIEIRRSKEGVARENGRVDLHKGTYNIEIQEPSGLIIGRLVSKTGQILGEGRIRLSHVDTQLGDKGPKLKIEPLPEPIGSIASLYQSAKSPTPPKTLATFLKGAHEVEIKKDGIVTLENLSRGSTTLLRAAAPNHMQTAALVTAGTHFHTPLFPNSMMLALKEIVYGQKLDEQAQKDLGGIVWGKVSLDGKAMPGVQVEIESQQGLQAIYFDHFMIPDPKLTVTSDNGLYAFVDVGDGFHSVLARRGESHFGYQNVVVESGSVALGDIENSLRSEPVPVRVFGAFDGKMEAAQVTLQGLENDLDLKEGADIVTLPSVSRWGLAKVVPDNTEYLSARYFYNDTDEFIHLPLVSWSWLSSIKTFLKLDDIPDTGILAGFVLEDSFEAFLAGDEDYNARNIVYFDVQGRILQTGKGVAGGGFIMYNVPSDIHEVVIVGEKNGKVNSQVVPLDPNSLSVLSFRE